MSINAAEKKIISGFGWSYIDRIANQAISVIVSIILARLLLPADYGVIAIVTVFISICDALVNGGMGNALVQKKDATDKDFNSICWLSVIIALGLYAILFISAPAISSFYQDSLLINLLRVMGIRLIFSAINSIQTANIQRNMLFKKHFLVGIIGTGLSAIVGIVAAVNGFGVWALVMQYLLKSLVDTVVLFFVLSWRPRMEISTQSIRSLWGYGAKVLGATVTYTLKDNIRSLIIGKKYSADDLAHYNQGQKFPSLIVNDSVEALSKVIFPALAQVQDEKEKVKMMMRQTIQVASFLLLPFVIGLFTIAENFVAVVLSEKWLPCVVYMQIMCLVYSTRAISAILQKGLLAIGKSSINLVHEILTSGLTIIFLLVAVFVFDSILLIAWSYLMVMVIGVVYYMFCAKRHLGYRFVEILKDYIPSLFISLLMAAGVYLFGCLTIYRPILLALQILLGAVLYIVLSILTKNAGMRFVCDLLKNKKGEKH